jgi:chemotaxis protein MotB
MARRQRKHEEHENHERWLVSYADFITLLFAFFTVLYATSQADVKKQEEFQDSFKKVMTSFGSGVGQGDGDADGGAKANLHKSLLTEHPDVFPPRGAGASEVQDHVQRVLDHGMKNPESAGTVTGVRHDTVGVRIQLAANKLFAEGSAELDPSSAAALDELGQLLKDSDRRLIIEGHTDDQPIHSARYPSNWELSAARATKIVRYLVARHKIPASRLTAIAYADQKPLVANDSEENRARNRRIEIMIVTDDKAANL